MKADTPKEPTEINVSITAVKGTGFEVEKRRFGKKDIPDVYCKITVGDKQWKTKTIKNCLEPVWDETKCFCVQDEKVGVEVQVYDEDDGIADKDDFLGMASFPIGALLTSRNNALDLLDNDGKPTGCCLTLLCKKE